MLDTINLFDAERIINSLRIGTVPVDYLQFFTCGREEWLNAVKEDLDFISKGASKVRFLSASYGGGKTHFINLIKDYALKQSFLVCYVELHSKESPFDKFEIIFAKIMRGINTSNSSQGLEDIFNLWVNNFKIYDRTQIEPIIKGISSSLDFRAALRSYLEYANVNTQEGKEHLQLVIGWLMGNKINNSFTKKSGIVNPVSISNVNEIFGSFLNFIKHIGYPGLIILLDEAEAVTSLAQSARRSEANQNIRKLLDNADNHKGMYIIFATTPKFLEDPLKGAKSYSALWERIKDILDLNKRYFNKRSLIIPLLPLEKTDLIKLSNYIIELHNLAYEWDSSNLLTKGDINQFTDVYIERTQNQLIRPFIRSLINILDILEQHQSINIKEEISSLSFN